MKKKILSLLLAATLLLSMLALVSCDTSKAAGMASFDVPEGGYDGSEVTIVFYHSMGAKLRGVLDTYIEEFNKLYPNITIEHSSMGDYDGVRDQIKTQLTAGEQPNIAYCYPDHVALYNVAKKVIPLDNLINSTIEVTDAECSTVPGASYRILRPPMRSGVRRRPSYPRPWGDSGISVATLSSARPANPSLVSAATLPND